MIIMKRKLYEGTRCLRAWRRVDRGEWMYGVFYAVFDRWGRFCYIAFDMLNSVLWFVLRSQD